MRARRAAPATVRAMTTTDGEPCSPSGLSPGDGRSPARGERRYLTVTRSSLHTRDGVRGSGGAQVRRGREHPRTPPSPQPPPPGREDRDSEAPPAPATRRRRARLGPPL